MNAQHTPCRARNSCDHLKILDVLGVDNLGRLKRGLYRIYGASRRVGEARSLPLELSPLQGLSEHDVMHAFGAEMFDNHVLVCSLFCHPNVIDDDVAGPVGSWPTMLHECHATQIVLVYKHWTNGAPLPLYEVLEEDKPSRGVGEINELCLGA